jgi:hypothetical protein
MKHEYHEGPEAKDRFDKLVTALFRAPKSTVKPPQKPVLTPKKPARANVSACLALAVS